MKRVTKNKYMLYFCCCIFYSTLVLSDAKKEFTVKAAFMVKLTHFIQWPNFPETQIDKPNFTICINHSFNINDALGKWAENGLIKNKPVSIIHFKNKHDQLAKCDMLYIADSNRLKYLLDQAEHHNILTVSSAPGNAKRGVLINFITKQGKLHFEINLNAAQELGFNINPRLLKLATIVSSEEIE